MGIPWLQKLPQAMFGETGHPVSVSGIYDVIGDDKHKEGHQVTCVKGETFPPCSECKHAVRFKLRMASHHLKEGPRNFH